MARVATIPQTGAGQASNLTNLFLSSLLQQQAAEAANTRLIDRQGKQNLAILQRQQEVDIQKRQLDQAAKAEESAINTARQDFLFGGIQPDFSKFQQQFPQSVQGITPEQFQARATERPNKADEYLSMLESYMKQTDPGLNQQAQEIIQLQQQFNFKKLQANLGFQQDIQNDVKLTGKAPEFDRLALFAARNGVTQEAAKMAEISERMTQHKTNLLISMEPRLVQMESSLMAQYAELERIAVARSRGTPEQRAGLEVRLVALAKQFDLLNEMKQRAAGAATGLGVDLGVTPRNNPVLESGLLTRDADTGEERLGTFSKLNRPTPKQTVDSLYNLPPDDLAEIQRLLKERQGGRK